MTALSSREDPRRHGLAEDLFAFVTGTLLVAIGLVFLKTAGLAIGGTAGIAFLVHYFTGWPLGAVIFAVNLPFYVFAWRGMGPRFAIRTFAAVALLSAETAVLPQAFALSGLDERFAALAGGLLIGVGILALIRHKASLGGVNILAFYLQERHGIRAGTVQMAIDAVIVAAAFAMLDPWKVAWSIAGALVLNLVLALNHKPGRYAGF